MEEDAEAKIGERIKWLITGEVLKKPQKDTIISLIIPSECRQRKLCGPFIKGNYPDEYTNLA